MAMINSQSNRLFRCIITGLCTFGLVSSCCFDRKEYSYFPEEAITYYNTHDTIVFLDTISGELDSLLVCSRDTNLSLAGTSGGYCPKEEYAYSIAYHLFMNSCTEDNTFGIQVYPNTRVSIHWKIPEIQRSFFSTTYNEEAQFDIELLGKTYENVIQIEDDSRRGFKLLFNLEYGIIQYQTPDSIPKILYNTER